MKDKRGAATDTLVWIVSAFIIVVFLAMWIFIFGQVNTVLTSVETVNGVNLTEAAEATISKVNLAALTLKFLAFMMILALAISIMISNYLIRDNPVFFVVHIIFTIAAVIVSAYISNAYESLLTVDPLGPILQSMTAGTFILLNLPLWATVIGIFGAIFLFTNIVRGEGLGGGL